MHRLASAWRTTKGHHPKSRAPDRSRAPQPHKLMVSRDGLILRVVLLGLGDHVPSEPRLVLEQGAFTNCYTKYYIRSRLESRRYQARTAENRERPGNSSRIQAQEQESVFRTLVGGPGFEPGASRSRTVLVACPPVSRRLPRCPPELKLPRRGVRACPPRAA